MSDNTLIKKTIEANIKKFDTNKDVFYYGINHLCLVQGKQIMCIIPKATIDSIDSIKECLELHGLKLVGKIDPSDVEGIETTAAFGVKTKWK